MKLIAFLFFFCSFSYSYQFDESSFKKIEFKSEWAFYDDIKSVIELSTNVIINNLNEDNLVIVKIKSDNAIVNIASSSIVLKTSFTVETSSMIINAEKGEYDFKENKGVFEKGISRYDRFIMKGKKIEINGDKYIYKSSFFTTCDKNPPHYHISSQRLSFVSGKYFLSYNNIFYIGKVPILYFPLIYKPLGKGTPVLSQFYPGYDKRNGFYIKSNYTYKFSSYTKFKLFVDYFSRRGWGFGGEVYKYNKDNIKLDVSYYRIDEYGDGQIQWGLNGGMWTKIYEKDRNELYLQNYIRLMSSPDFNNNYFRSNPFAISDDKQWDISLTYKMPFSYLRANTKVLYKRYGDYEFIEATNISPKLEYQTITQKIKFLPINHSLYLSVENSRYDNTFFRKKISGVYTLSNSFNISKKVSFYNSVSYSGNIKFSTSSNLSDVVISRYYYNSGLRYSTLSNSYELGYNGIFRSKENKISIDKDSADKGVEKSNLSLSIYLFNSIDKYFRFNNNYDLRNNHLKFKDRFSPFSFEFYKKFSNYEIYFKDDYDINKGNKSFITQLSSDYDKNYLNIGFANYASNRERFIISNTIGYYPSPQKGWYGEFTLRYYVDFSKDMGVKFFEKSFIINKEFHDFRAKFLFRNRKDVNEFFFYVTMKMNDPYRKNNIDREIDEFFKPWRKFDEERDY
ncbi:MAG: hypothetical protein K6357_08440 [Elusimicrobiota bacterium]